MNANEILKLELKKSFDFFWDFSNKEENSKGYGLIVDKTSLLDRASIAGSGFALTAIVIGVENGFITREEGLNHVRLSLKTLAYNVDHYNGFFAHFVDINTGERFKHCEYSTIDTSLCLNGVITVESYFNDAEVSKYADIIISRIDWKWLTFEREGKLLFHMAYNPDQDGDYRNGKTGDGFIHQWDHYAEQQLMHFQAVSDESLSKQEQIKLYRDVDKPRGSYGGEEFIYTLGGSMFIYQFANAWFPFQDYLDVDNINWAENSKNAILANREYCIKQTTFKTLNENIWGLNAGYSPSGYLVAGGPPTVQPIEEKHGDGTVQQYGIVSSINFIEDIVKESIEHIYNNHPKSFGEYGFTDGMNLEVNWFSDEYLSLDKGISIIMIDNYFNQTTWKYFTESKYTKKAIEVLDFKKR